MLTEERVNQLGLVCREVVDDDVNFLAAPLMGHDVGEEGDELGRGMPRGGLAQHFTSLGIEGGVQRERSMPEVLKAMTLGTPRRERQNRVFAIERLNLRLLLDAEDGRILRRGLRQRPVHLGCVVIKVRVVWGNIALEPYHYTQLSPSNRPCLRRQ